MALLLECYWKYSVYRIITIFSSMKTISGPFLLHKSPFMALVISHRTTPALYFTSSLWPLTFLLRPLYSLSICPVRVPQAPLSKAVKLFAPQRLAPHCLLLKDLLQQVTHLHSSTQTHFTAKSLQLTTASSGRPPALLPLLQNKVMFMYTGLRLSISMSLPHSPLAPLMACPHALPLIPNISLLISSQGSSILVWWCSASASPRVPSFQHQALPGPILVPAPSFVADVHTICTQI